MIVQEEGEALTIQSGPSPALMRTVKKAEIKSKKAQPSSPMPQGLLNTLTADEIIDLLAFVKAGGNVPIPEHQH